MSSTLESKHEHPQFLTKTRNAKLLLKFGYRHVSWRSPFRKKHKKIYLLLLRNPKVYPVITMHLAAVIIGKVIRGNIARRKLRDRLMGKRDRKTKGAVRAEERARKKKVRAQYELDLQHLGLEPHQFKFKYWCARHIQAIWRTRMAKRLKKYEKYEMYDVAAIVIQREWRTYWQRRTRIKARIENLRQAACAIQRAWRSYTTKRIYRYFRDLILWRNQSEPTALVKSLNPRESALADASSGLYVRFRLGGMVFPPIIYYKIYTNQAVTDICAFAPRDYVRERTRDHKTTLNIKKTANMTDQERREYERRQQLTPEEREEEDRQHWYKRWENNGWRPISDKLLYMNDPVTAESSNKKVEFHHSRLVRQVDLLKKRKRRKLRWLQKMYKLNPNKDTAPSNNVNINDDNNQDLKYEGTYQQDVKNIDNNNTNSEQKAENEYAQAVMENLLNIDPNTDDVFEKDWEDEADELIEWTNALDFESYQDNWFATATSRPADRYYRDYDPDWIDNGRHYALDQPGASTLNIGANPTSNSALQSSTRMMNEKATSYNIDNTMNADNQMVAGSAGKSVSNRNNNNNDLDLDEFDNTGWDDTQVDINRYPSGIPQPAVLPRV